MRRFLDFTIRIMVIAALFAGLLGTARTGWVAATPFAVPASHSSPQTTFFVSNTFDNGAGSLRQALLDANTTPGEDVIHINAIGTVNLLSPLPTITEAVTIFVEDAHVLRIFIVNAQNLYPGLDILFAPVTISGLIVQNGLTGTGGGGIFSFDDLTLNDVHVLNSSANIGGGVYSTGSVVVNGGRYEGNIANSGGGAIYAGGALTVNGSIIQNNHCTTSSSCRGGGLYAGNTLTMTNTEIISNTTAGSGGGVFAGGTAVITGTLFIGNTAASNGGGATITGGGPVQITVTNSRFENNSSGGSGGGMSVAIADTMTLNDVDFVDNEATFHGGGLLAGDVIINGGRFEGNTALNSGGGLNGGNVMLTDTHFISNTTSNGGGGAAVRNNIVATGGSFEYNVGGALEVTSRMVLTDTQFLNNSGYFAAFAFRTQATNVLFANNGYGALESGGETRVAGSQFVNNGRGIVATGSLTVTNSLFMNTVLEGVAQFGTGDVSIVNALFASNVALEDSAAVSLRDNGTATLQHVTIANSEQGASMGITTTKEIVLIQNSIIANHNTGLNVPSGFVVLSHALFHDNGLDIQGRVASDDGRVTGDPLFVNPGVGDYHLQSGSAAVDAGIDVGITEDFEGDARPLLNGFDVGFDEAALSRVYQVMLPIIIR